MQFDWTTFVLELLNFLVLLWLLKHFFYRPVLGVLDARKQAVLDQVAQADTMQKQAAALQAQYEARLQDWHREQEQARQALQQELGQERARQLEALKKTLADERAKGEAQARAQDALREARLARQASGVAYRQAAAMLARLAQPELTERIAEVVAEDLIALDGQRQRPLRDAAAALGAGAAVEVGCAHPLPDAALRILGAALEQAAGQALELQVAVRPELIAGVRIALGECLLQADLADELAFLRGGSADETGSPPDA